MRDHNQDDGDEKESHINNNENDQSTTIHHQPDSITLPQNLESLTNIVELQPQPNTETSSHNADVPMRRSFEESSKLPLIECDMRQNPRERRAKRTRSNEEHVSSERRRRDRLRQKLTALKELLPNISSPKLDQASLLDQAIRHIKSLQSQLQALSMMGAVVPFNNPIQNLLPIIRQTSNTNCLIPSVQVSSPYSINHITDITQRGVTWNPNTRQHEMLQSCLSNTMLPTTSIVHGFEDQDLLLSFSGSSSSSPSTPNYCVGTQFPSLPSSTWLDPMFGTAFGSFSSIPQPITHSSHFDQTLPIVASGFVDQSTSSYVPILPNYDRSIRGESSNRVVPRNLSDHTFHQVSDIAQAASSSVRPSSSD